MPQPPVPEGLEARLLAAVPCRMPAPRRRWAVRALMACAVAAACLLAVLAWPRRDNKVPAPAPPKQEVVHKAPPGTPERPTGLAAWARAGRDPEAAELPPFTWPLGEAPPATLATAISPDLLE